MTRNRSKREGFDDTVEYISRCDPFEALEAKDKQKSIMPFELPLNKNPSFNPFQVPMNVKMSNAQKPSDYLDKSAEIDTP